jgi:hypothetical protein
MIPVAVVDEARSLIAILRGKYTVAGGAPMRVFAPKAGGAGAAGRTDRRTVRRVSAGRSRRRLCQAKAHGATLFATDGYYAEGDWTESVLRTRMWSSVRVTRVLRKSCGLRCSKAAHSRG